MTTSIPPDSPSTDLKKNELLETPRKNSIWAMINVYHQINNEKTQIKQLYTFCFHDHFLIAVLAFLNPEIPPDDRLQRAICLPGIESPLRDWRTLVYLLYIVLRYR